MNIMFTSSGLLQIAIYFAVLFALVKPLGGYMARVYSNQSLWLDKILGPLERLFYKAAGGGGGGGGGGGERERERERERGGGGGGGQWTGKNYTLAVLLFSSWRFFILLYCSAALAIAFQFKSGKYG